MSLAVGRQDLFQYAGAVKPNQFHRKFSDVFGVVKVVGPWRRLEEGLRSSVNWDISLKNFLCWALGLMTMTKQLVRRA